MTTNDNSPLSHMGSRIGAYLDSIHDALIHDALTRAALTRAATRPTDFLRAWQELKRTVDAATELSGGPSYRCMVGEPRYPDVERVAAAALLEGPRSRYEANRPASRSYLEIGPAMETWAVSPGFPSTSTTITLKNTSYPRMVRPYVYYGFGNDGDELDEDGTVR